MQLNFFMAKFVTKTVSAVKGKQKFKALVIVDDKVDAVALQNDINEKEENGKEVTNLSVLDNYENELEAKYKSPYLRIIGNMNRVANLQSVSQDKFKDITPNKDDVAEYEFKYGDLRVYTIKVPDGQLVMLGGYKNKQTKNISEFRSRKKEYLNYLKSVR